MADLAPIVGRLNQTRAGLLALLDEKQVMLERFQALRTRTLAFVEANQHRDLSRWRYPHPFFGSLNIYSWLKNIYHHEIRHTKQLREIARSV